MRAIVSEKLTEFVGTIIESGRTDPEDVVGLMIDNPEYYRAYHEAMSLIHYTAVPTMAGGVYSIPVLEPESCDKIVELARQYDYKVNEEESEAYRIDEAVLQAKDPDLYDALGRALLPVLNTWSLLIYQRPITKVASFQIARYTHCGTRMTGYHHDRDSDVTAVISLNPGEFSGGGTDIRTMADRFVHVDPLPKGHALFFNGKMIHHRGAPVTEGERYLLVCWLESEI